MKVNNFLDTALTVYNLFPFADYSYEDYSKLVTMYKEIKDINQVLLKVGCCEGLSHQILKTITLTSSYFFRNKTIIEQESLSLEFILLFFISKNDKELKRERIKMLKVILANMCKMNSSFQVSIVELISNLYLVYCICETFIGTSVIFFSFLSETENLIKENKFVLFYNDFVQNDKTAMIDENEYEQVQYKELLLMKIGMDNSSKIFKLFIEYFAGNKIEIESIDEENIEEVILTSVKQRFIVFDHINFDKLLDSIPQVWCAKANLEFLLSN